MPALVLPRRFYEQPQGAVAVSDPRVFYAGIATSNFVNLSVGAGAQTTTLTSAQIAATRGGVGIANTASTFSVSLNGLSYPAGGVGGARTWVTQFVLNSFGGGGFGRVFDKRSSELMYIESAGINYAREGSTQQRARTSFVPSFGVLYTVVAVAPEFGTAAPSVYVNGALQSLGLATSGSVVASYSDDYWMGNRQNGRDRNFDGTILLLAGFDAAVSPDEAVALSTSPYSELFRPVPRRIYFDMGAGGGVTISCTPGNADAAGIAATINGSANITCAPGSAVAVGASAQISSNVSIACTPGDASASGIAAQISSNAVIVCSVGSAAAEGTAATINGSANITCAPGSAVAAGTAAAIEVAGADSITCTPGDASASGIAAQISSNAVIVCSVGSAAAEGTAATINGSANITCAPGSAVAAGTAAAIEVAGADSITCTPGDASASGIAAQISSNAVIVCSVGSAAAEGTAATINGSANITCTPGSAVAAGTAAAIEVAGADSITCTVGNAVAVGVMAQIASDIVIGASVGNAVAAGLGATLEMVQTITCSVGNATGAGITAALWSDSAITCTPGNAVAGGVVAGLPSEAGHILLRTSSVYVRLADVHGGRAQRVIRLLDQQRTIRVH